MLQFSLAGVKQDERPGEKPKGGTLSFSAAGLGYQVKLDQFEGPLALLLHLIRKEEMDIYDIKITKITKQYLDFIKNMRQLDLEVAGEFVAMAATLIQVKSRMLLPSYDENGDVVEDEDPRKELVQKLLEYQKYQEVSAKLNDRPLQGRDFWAKGAREQIDAAEEGEILIDESNALFALIGMYRKVIRSIKKNVHIVGMRGQSIAQRILELRRLLVAGRKTNLTELVTEGTAAGSEHSNNVLITFLSLLELGRMGFVSLFQSEAYAEIYVDVGKEVSSDVVLRVEEYDSAGSEKLADSLMSAEEPSPEEQERADEKIAVTDEMIAATDDDITAEEARGIL